LSAAVLLAGLALLVLCVLWLRNRTGGLIATVLITVAWFVWMSRLLKPAIVLAAAASVSIVLLGSVTAVILGLYIVAGFLVPMTDRGGERSRLFMCLIDYTLGQNRPYYVVTDGPREEDRLARRVRGDSFGQFSRGPGFVICDCDHAVAVSDGIILKGVQGPGVVFTTRSDQPQHALDLRAQLRSLRARGLTQDGIEVEVRALISFHIARGGRKPQPGRPFPYRRSAATDAVRAQKMEHRGTSERPERVQWDDLPEITGRRLLQDILSRYRFDGLYGPYDVIEEPPPRVRIAREFVNQLRGELRRFGIHLVGGGISNLMPVEDEVLQQRVRSWQADWIRRAMLKQAESQAERLRRIEQARAETQADMILTLGERLTELDGHDVEVTPEKIVPQFLRTLEEMALRPALRRYIPPDTVQGVRRLRESFRP
jgi:regulator of protease activity HflC (stomatin/prohibitin superfamily)